VYADAGFNNENAKVSKPGFDPCRPAQENPLLPFCSCIRFRAGITRRDGFDLDSWHGGIRSLQNPIQEEGV